MVDTLIVNNDDESLAISAINKYLEERIFDKRKKEVCLVFNKKPSVEFFKMVLLAFYDYKSAYLKMIKYEKRTKCHLEKVVIHAGENVTYTKPLIIVGNVHAGANVYISSNIVFIGEVKGNIYLNDEHASIYADNFNNAVFIDHHGHKKYLSDKNRLINYEEMEAM